MPAGARWPCNLALRWLKTILLSLSPGENPDRIREMLVRDNFYRIRLINAADRFVEIKLPRLRTGMTASHMGKAVLVSVDDQFQPVGNTELAEDGCQMMADRRFRDEETFAYLFTLKCFSHQRDHFEFARSE